MLHLSTCPKRPVVAVARISTSPCLTKIMTDVYKLLWVFDSFNEMKVLSFTHRFDIVYIIYMFITHYITWYNIYMCSDLLLIILLCVSVSLCLLLCVSVYFLGKSLYPCLLTLFLSLSLSLSLSLTDLFISDRIRSAPPLPHQLVCKEWGWISL